MHNHLTLCKRIVARLKKTTLSTNYALTNMYKKDLALINLEWFIWHKTQSN